MARFRGARYLSCFYCGKRSGLKYDGVTRDFLCLYCDATNYLDEVIARLQPPGPATGSRALMRTEWRDYGSSRRNGSRSDDDAVRGASAGLAFGYREQRHLL